MLGGSGQATELRLNSDQHRNIDITSQPSPALPLPTPRTPWGHTPSPAAEYLSPGSFSGVQFELIWRVVLNGNGFWMWRGLPSPPPLFTKIMRGGRAELADIHQQLCKEWSYISGAMFSRHHWHWLATAGFKRLNCHSGFFSNISGPLRPSADLLGHILGKSDSLSSQEILLAKITEISWMMGRPQNYYLFIK